MLGEGDMMGEVILLARPVQDSMPKLLEPRVLRPVASRWLCDAARLTTRWLWESSWFCVVVVIA